MLCLDGGGIKGLILTQLLMAIEKETGKTSKEMFDWIAGTSTGALLALGLAQNRSAVEVQRLYFNMKDKIFKGSRPYKAEPFEDFLKQELGEHTTMECLKDGPKVIITASLADRKPVRLHLFRNYSLASDNLPKKNNFSSKVKPEEIDMLLKNEPPFDQLLWKVARCSGAAPTYFRPMDNFLDGGLLANNPTLDTLTEIHKYNKEVRCCSSESKQVGIVLSLGTGLIATSVARSTEVSLSANPLELYNAAMAGLELSTMLVDAACECDGHVSERAKAWCESIGANYYRLNPLLDEDIAMDETDDATLLNVIWETQKYIYNNKDLISEIADLLLSE